MLNKRGESRHPCLVPDLRGERFQSFTIKLVLPLFFIDAFIKLRSSLLFLVAIFIMKGFWILLNAFSESMKMIVWGFFLIFTFNLFIWLRQVFTAACGIFLVAACGLFVVACRLLAVACIWALVPWPWIEPGPPALDHRVLTTGPPGKSLYGFFLTSINIMYYIDWFSNVKLTFHPWINPTWSWRMIFFICCWFGLLVFC